MNQQEPDMELLSATAAVKQEFLVSKLATGMIMISVDPTCPGVDLPAHLLTEPIVRLNLSQRFGIPIQINSWGVRASLSFGPLEYPCRVPWLAIFACLVYSEQKIWLFAESLPPRVAEIFKARLKNLEREKATQEVAEDPSGEVISLVGETVKPSKPQRKAPKRPQPAAKPTKSKSKLKSNTALVEQRAASASPSAPADLEDASQVGKRRGHLRIIK